MGEEKRNCEIEGESWRGQHVSYMAALFVYVTILLISAVFKLADPGSYISIPEPQSRKVWHDMCLYSTISGIGGRNG